jgi:4,5-dihydroxyphthalate decarboxylase
MNGKPLHLSISIADTSHVAPLKSGEVAIDGVEPDFVDVKPQIAAYRRMVRNLEFDVCELAPTTYLIARALGAPIIALPIFLMRRFHHGGVLVRPDAGIRAPRDLEGRKVGVRAWSVTTGAWTRSILSEDYGLDISRVTWVVDDDEHVPDMKLPSNVVHAPEGVSLIDMMTSGAIQAGFAGNAGLGRAGAPTAGWDKRPIPEADAWPDLFDNPAELEAAWFRRTGIYPIHGTIVVRESLLGDHPWLAKSLHEAFSRAKEAWAPAWRDGRADSATDRQLRAMSAIVGPDPLPFGMSANLPSIEALERLAWKQGLTSRRLSLADLFVDPATL